MPRAGDTAGPDPLLRSLLDEFASIQRISIDSDGTIRGANETLAGQLGVALGRLQGRPIVEIMTESDGPTVLQWAQGAELPATPRLLNFVNMNHQPFTLRCIAARMDGALHVVGEAADTGPVVPAEQLMQVNNEFATLTRELERRGRELERTQAKLDRALAELDAAASAGRLPAAGSPCPTCGAVTGTGDPGGTGGTGRRGEAP